ncbi:hypothetical protein ACFCXF_26845 [Streptomyces virginiae]|uniref:hypothetical protein n=1 Tax=Streptomyces virginiae TaxID=1961 RepID=UPI000A7B0C7C|nr:hypothetical protein [Streptomyces virginiae]
MNNTKRALAALALAGAALTMTGTAQAASAPSSGLEVPDSGTNAAFNGKSLSLANLAENDSMNQDFAGGFWAV